MHFHSIFDCGRTKWKVVLAPNVPFKMDLLERASTHIALLMLLRLYSECTSSMLLINGTQPACLHEPASPCTQICSVSAVCPVLSCNATLACTQNATNASSVADVLCASEICVQTMNRTRVNRMHAMALLVTQVSIFYYQPTQNSLKT